MEVIIGALKILLIGCLVISAGVHITYLVKLKLFLEERLLWGIFLGLVFFGFSSLILSYIFYSVNVGGYLSLAVTFIFGLGLTKYRGEVYSDWRSFRQRLEIKSWKLFWLAIAILGLWMSYLLSNLLVYRDGAYWVAPVHAYGDIALHMSQISSFLYGDNLPITNPVMSGEKISYPFLVNWITAEVMAISGVGMATAVAFLGGVVGFCFVGLVGFFCLRLELGKLASVMAIVLILLNGGLGFVFFLEEFIRRVNFNVGFLLNLPYDYTAFKDLNFWWINMILSLFMPQRSFLLGILSSFTILYCLWLCVRGLQIRIFLLAMMLVGLMPVIHTHSLLALAPFVAILMLLVWKNNLRQTGVILFGGLVSLAMIYFLSNMFLSQGSNLAQMIRVQVGWMSGHENKFLFFVKNFGIYPFLYVVSLIWGIYRKKTVYLYVALVASVWFIVPSFVVFQPWDYDNTKLFAYWYILSVPLVASFLLYLYRSNFLLAIIFFVLLIFSGSLDVFRLTAGLLVDNPNIRYVTQSKEAIALAEFIKTNTDPDRVILSVDKFGNSASTLAGRKVVIGFRSWLWTYGIDYSNRLNDLRAMLDGSASEEVYKNYNIGYIIVFPEQSGFVVNVESFDGKYQLIYDLNGYRVYKI